MILTNWSFFHPGICFGLSGGFFSGKDDNNCFGSKKENTGIVKTIKQFINWLRQDQLQKKTDFYFKNP